ncbi:uncharacterized protein ACB058_008436 [Synchiropus picturatus]
MKTVSAQSLLLISTFLFLCAAAELQAPVVHTKLGSLRGEVLTVKGTENKVHSFLGVPFAKPPVGPALRLAAPQDPEGWEGVRDATKQPPMCIQDKALSVEMFEEILRIKAEIPEVSEDCLFLNIYTPATRPHDAKLPVMVWIHGGGFVMGFATMYDGSALAAYENVVVVSIQYRLGVLGYLSTGDEHMAGNWGMLDQVQALKWVQEHIHNFGGASNSVTIFGESAGGVSVSLLLLSPLTEGLFHKAIAESGTAAMEPLVQENSLAITQMVANMSGCSVESTEKIAECMKNLDMEKLNPVVKEPTLRYPVIRDEHFLTKPVKQLFENHDFHMVPFITGINDDEGGYIMLRYLAPPNWTEGLDREQVSNTLSAFLPDVKVRELVLEEYGVTSDDRVKNRDALTRYMGDLFFNIPAVVTANAHRDAGAPVYLYEYRYIHSLLKLKRPSFVRCDHGDDIFSVFGFCFTQSHFKLPDPCLAEDEQVARTVMSYWGNFARTGSPNGKGLVHWPKYDKDEPYLAIAEEQVADHHLKSEHFIFMTETLPEKIQQLHSTTTQGKQDHKELLRTTPVVHTKLGSLRGELLTVNGTENKVHSFLGVPFAKPPVGPALRLAPPQDPEGWEGVRDATKQPLMCMQDRNLNVEVFQKNLGLQIEIPEVSEDCLYLNIYTPATRPHDAKLPVMVWIHGGGFLMGYATMYDGSALAAYENVVVVSIQYRLGLLGYLSTGDEHMAGNWGMLDQVQALKWVQEHIHNFGGASNSVTIFGESAGGVSVSLLLLSPLTEGLFHKAIAESGTAAMEPLVRESSLVRTQMAANKSGCSIESTEKFAECMRNLDMETLNNLVMDPALKFPVIRDGHFLTKPVKQLLENHEFHKVPFLTGVNSDEGGYSLTRFVAPPNWTEGLDREQVSNSLSVFLPEVKVRELVLEEYGVTSDDRVKNRDALTLYLADLFFNIPAVVTANAHRDAGAPVYLYEYRYIHSLLKSTRPSFVRSDHGDDIFSVFGFCFTQSHCKLPDPCSVEDEQVARTIMSYWGNFARTGSPNGKGLVHWPKYDKDEPYLAIAEEQVVDHHLKNEHFVFMTKTLPEKIRELYSTATQGKQDDNEL